MRIHLQNLLAKSSNTDDENDREEISEAKDSNRDGSIFITAN